MDESTTTIEDVVTSSILELGFENRTYLTLYEVSKVLNLASGKNTPSQMMYNYERQNLIPTNIVEIDGTKKKRVLATDAMNFVMKYVKRNTNL